MPPPPLERHYIGLLERPEEVAATAAMDLKHTELRLGLPGGSESPGRSDGAELGLTLGLAKSCVSGAKRGFSFSVGGKHLRLAKVEKDDGGEEKAVQSAKARAIGWPPIRSYRKKTMAGNPAKNKEDQIKQGAECLYIKVSMDGAPYLRKVDLRTHSNYQELSLALEKMFTHFSISREVLNEGQGSEYVLTYEDKDGDWMLVGDVPWEMFTSSCRRLRIMKGSDAIGEIQEQEVTMAEDQRN